MRWIFLAMMAVTLIIGLWLFTHIDNFWWRVGLGGAYGGVTAAFTERFGTLMGWWNHGKEEPPEE